MNSDLDRLGEIITVPDSVLTWLGDALSSIPQDHIVYLPWLCMLSLTGLAFNQTSTMSRAHLVLRLFCFSTIVVIWYQTIGFSNLYQIVYYLGLIILFINFDE